MIEIYAHEFKLASETLAAKMLSGEVKAGSAYYQAILPLLELLQQVCPEQSEYSAWRAEYFHLDGNLRRAGEQYKRTLELAPPEPLEEREIRFIRKFCPMLLTTPLECFPLKDVAAVHHPTLPLIGYHLFWEDDYDFPDDYEPCDHEEIWVEYDPHTEAVTNVLTFFHSSVIESQAAVQEAHENDGRPIVRIEWGKHGSLLKGWENLVIPMKEVTAMEWLQETFEQVKAGGRVPDHPLKRHWPKGFEGGFEDFTNFSVPVDPLQFLNQKPLLFKSLWVNAIIYTEGLLYNFHPKMEWPQRFQRI
ncbi:hypothetical protein [Paenibacillus sp. Soil724D2]|uniref:hypothetical protein n=1 Tax=Paenibacillus sp. (strain Soil724D2) TaxID=1736392 RepID=UPI000712A108|nr:hypothetical protein [Paenibacillus sp. Soil724D2]KRE34122.1 hypothetical protein ASG85_12135 [Paenibacillus sp. Soil724D2]